VQGTQWRPESLTTCTCAHAFYSHDANGRCRAMRGRCKCRKPTPQRGDAA
jgi:hypothetical protein